MRPRSYNVTLEPGQTLLLDQNFQIYNQPAKKREVGAYQDISIAKCLLHTFVFTATMKILMKYRGTTWGQTSVYVRKLTNW